jgi:hypothetical protein
MATVYFNSAIFRAMFPVFKDTSKLPDSYLQLQWDLATSFITNNTWTACYAGMNAAQQVNSLNLMTAHLVALNQAIAAGQPAGLVTGATIDKVSVTLEPPPGENQWQWWLNQTPYGQQLLALLQVMSAGGYSYFAGAPANFRRRGW